MTTRGGKGSDPVERAVALCVTRLGLTPRDTVLVGYSGGPDSTALLAALVASGACAVRALHVDHGLRPQAERDAELSLVRSVCRRLEVELTVARIALGAIDRLAHRGGEGVESAARAFRYRALRATASRLGACRIFLGHTGDDVLETVLMRFLSGSGAAGLRGIRSGLDSIDRPLLGSPKSDILAYLKMRGLEYSTDSTNVRDSYLRNKIRHGLMPFLDVNHPGWRKGLLSSSAKARIDESAFDGLVSASNGGFILKSPGEYRADSASFFAESLAVQLRLFLKAAGKLSGKNRISFRMAQEALHLTRRSGSTYRGADFALYNEDGVLILRHGLDFPGPGGYFVEITAPGSHVTESLVVEARWVLEPQSCGIRENAFSFPLAVRSRRPGDAIRIVSGNKPLDELLSEWGVPPEKRNSVPVIEDGDGIVAVLGSGFGGKNRFRQSDCAESSRFFSIELKGVRASNGF